jgi:hypothetical protein
MTSWSADDDASRLQGQWDWGGSIKATADRRL